RIRERTTEGRRRAMDRDGAPPCCFLAFGYRLAANGQWQIDPVEGPIVQRMFAMAEEGCSNREIQAWLDSLPGLRAGRRFARRAERQTLIVRGQEDARWAKSTVARLLASRTYCGARQFAGRTFAVPALVSEEQWARVQAIRSGAAGHMRQRAGLPPAGFLSGLLRCGLCGGTIHADLKLINSGDKAPPANARYRCEGITTTPRACRLRQFRCWALDDQVWPALEAFVRDPGELLRRAIRQGGEQEQSLDDLVGREQEAGGQLAGLEGQIADVWEMQRRNNWPLSHVEAGIRQLHEQQDKLRLLLEHLRIEKGKLQAERDGVDALAANLASLGTLADAARGDYGLRGKIARMLIAKGVVVSEGPGRKAPIDVRLSLRWGETVTVAAAEVGNGSHRRPGLPQTGQTQPGAPMTLPLQFRVLSRGKCQRVG
ncbi:MAG TPA: recombinase family protein, partial [Hyphomicrobiaceae bacterium]|nr:recombinase family protein [Hyphomicrobiaceae bacterium]